MRARPPKSAASRSVIYIALIGNTLVAISKFVAAALTGSSAMLSEGVHSVVDTANECLLLYGAHRGSARPDGEHPLGYGREVYFWSFVVALLIFMLGAGISAYEGVVHILDPHPIEDPAISYAVLALAALFEGSSWLYTLRRFKGKRPYSELPSMVIQSKDAPTFIILLEDSAAMIGIAIAAAGIYCSLAFEDPRLDGVASVFIGITLALAAALLARETKGLLIGEAANKKTRDSILALTAQTEGVIQANDIFSVHIAPEEIVVALEVRFARDLRTPEIEALIEQLEQKIHGRHPAVVAVFVKPTRHRQAAMETSAGL